MFIICCTTRDRKRITKPRFRKQDNEDISQFFTTLKDDAKVVEDDDLMHNPVFLARAAAEKKMGGGNTRQKLKPGALKRLNLDFAARSKEKKIPKEVRKQLAERVSTQA